ncbi:hypothetical protein J6O86_02925 [bacterium]|nr:hypothetical protein [bacterium]
MSNKIQFKRGLKQNLPSSADAGMPLWCTDTQELYIGTGNGVSKVGVNEDTSEESQTLNLKVTSLSNYGTFNLEDNSINRINATNTVTFNLPEISTSNEFHQILVQLYMSYPRTINLGTTHFFNSKVPDLSEAGKYNIIFEHDGTNWVCGVIKKG